MFEAVIFDFDGTLYDYEKPNLTALSAVFEKIASLYPYYTIDNIKSAYQTINQEIKLSNNPAAKFNKYIYMKKLVEYLHLPLAIIDSIHYIYNTTFFQLLHLYDGVEELLNTIKKRDRKIGILSNNVFSQQYNKLDYFGIMDKIDVLLTSDECGEEKPHHSCFLEMANRLHLSNNKQILMVGDNWEADIVPALRLGMSCAYFTKEENAVPHFRNNVFVFTNIVQLNMYIEYIDTAMQQYDFLAKLFGQSPTCIQGTGGNISVKLPPIRNDVLMIVKSSGYTLSESACLVANNPLKNAVELTSIPVDLKKVVITHTGASAVPSMESYFHSFMKPICIHLHYTLSNILFCDGRHQDFHTIDAEFPSNYRMVPYIEPGFNLSKKIRTLYSEHIPIYFLKNHGIILTGETPKEVANLFLAWHIYLIKYIKLHCMYGIADTKFTYLKKWENEIVAFKICREFATHGLFRAVSHFSISPEYIQKIKYCFPDLAIFIDEPIYIRTIDELSSLPILENISVLLLGNQTFLIASSNTRLSNLKEILGEYAILCDFAYAHLEDISGIHALRDRDDEKFRKTLS